jgi:hypothetical protein
VDHKVDSIKVETLVDHKVASADQCQHLVDHKVASADQCQHLVDHKVDSIKVETLVDHKVDSIKVETLVDHKVDSADRLHQEWFRQLQAPGLLLRKMQWETISLRIKRMPRWASVDHKLGQQVAESSMLQLLHQRHQHQRHQHQRHQHQRHLKHRTSSD